MIYYVADKKEAKHMYEITITIPVYNAGKYLGDLLESIIHQTFDYHKIEVIMVDDCSTDNSRDVMDDYAAKYENFISVKLDKNHKIAGTARNKGMELAHGKYLMFADADDFYPEDAIQVMYDTIENKQADFIIANYINTDEDGTLWEKPIFNTQKYQEFRLDIRDYTKSFFVLNGSSCNKIYRRDFVQKHHIQFLEGVPAEDAYFVNGCFLNSKTAYYIPHIMYCYRQIDSHKGASVSHMRSKGYFEGINTAYKAIYEEFKEKGQLAFYRYTYAKNMSYMLYKFIDSEVLSYEEKVEVLKEMRWFYCLSESLKVPACQRAQQMIVEKIIQEKYNDAINYCEIVRDIRSYLPKQVKEDMSRPDAEMYQNISQHDKEYQE